MNHSYPPKPSPGDRIAVVSPSAGLPELFPAPFEQGLRRLREDFELEPVEYPTTRVMNAAPADRAADLHAAFADETIKAVISSIGGDDQIRVLRHLDPDILRANPKPFFGWSDNTNLLAFLYQLGIVGYYGGAVMAEFGRGGRMHPDTARSLRAALFESGEYQLTPPARYTEIDRDWTLPESLTSEPQTRPAPEWLWNGPRTTVSGRGWGGCLDIVPWLCLADIAVPRSFEDTLIFLETSEEMPAAEEVYRVLRGLGERGALDACVGLLMGRPKAWSFEEPQDDTARAEYVAAQHAAVSRAMGEYAPETPFVLDVDFGHTDPRFVIPYGGTIRLDGRERTVTVRY